MQVEGNTGSPALSPFTDQKYLVIESYRKNGEGVRTPVWFVESQGTLYVRTDNDTGKFKRIGRNPTIRIAPCNARGTPKGPWIEAEATIATREETEQAYQLLGRKYGLSYRAVRLMGRLRGRGNKGVVLAIKA